MGVTHSIEAWTRRGTRLASRSIAVVVLVLGVLATGDSLASVSAQVAGVYPDLYVSGLTLFWFSFRFDGFAWVPWILSLGLVSVGAAILSLQHGRNVGVLVACAGWLGVSVLVPPSSTLDMVLCVSSSGLAIVWLVMNLREPGSVTETGLQGSLPR
jgi:hypothetical protein